MSGHHQATKVAVLDDYQNVARSFADWEKLAPRGEAVFFHDHVEDRTLLASRLAPFDAVVLTRERTVLDADMISRLPNLKLIASVGMWNAAIDLKAAADRAVVVSGTETNYPNGTPALTWALILSAMRGVYREAASLRAGGWQTGIGMDTAGKTLGVLGLGKIGRVVAQVGSTLGMRVIAWSQNLTEEAARTNGATWVSKEDLFRQSDVITVHLKLSARTSGIVDEAEIALMKPTAFLVNTSRGPLISEQALVAALTSRRIAGAALDVFDTEPLPADHPYRFLPNVLATPHIGYVTENTYADAFPQIVENIGAWLDGKPIRLMLA
jgi:phosphoglycerate dehydrogenase-like enzyme